MPTSVYRQAEHPLTIEAGPAESVHIDEGGDGDLELPENYDDDAYEGWEAAMQLQADAAASESLALRLGSPRFERPSALSPFAEEAVDEASASPELEAPPPPADSGGASSSLAPVTERSASWRRQLAERSAADAQEEAPPPAAARSGKRPVDGRRAAAARLGKQIAEKERQKEEAIADAKLAKMNVSLLQQRCEGLVDELRRMHAAEAEAREQAARDEKEARRAYAEAERAARAEVEEMMGGFFSELSALDGFADADGFADSDDDDGAGDGGEGDGDAVAAGLRRGDPSVFDAVAAAFPEHFAAARAALAEAPPPPPPPPRPARGASAGRRGGPTAAAPAQRARPAAPAATPAARQREASAAASAKRLPGLKATYGKGLGAYAAKPEKPRRAGSGGRSRKELGVVAAPAARSATARLADGRLALPSR